MTTTHCDRCGLKTAVLAIPGERSSQYVCQTSREVFERDNPAGAQHEFRTMARPQNITLPAIAGCPAVLPEGGR